MTTALGTAVCLPGDPWRRSHHPLPGLLLRGQVSALLNHHSRVCPGRFEGGQPHPRPIPPPGSSPGSAASTLLAVEQVEAMGTEGAEPLAGKPQTEWTRLALKRGPGVVLGLKRAWGCS